MKHICVTAQIMTASLWNPAIQGRYVIDLDSGCWNWTGRIDRSGYGRVRMRIGGRLRETGAHRASWIAHRGPVLSGLTIDHLCLNKLCVNPYHLEPVTREENVRRAFEVGLSEGRPRVDLPERSGCKSHGVSDGKWRTRKDGYTIWDCKPCARARMKAWEERQMRHASGE